MQFRCLLAGVAALLCAAGCGDDGGDALPVTTTSSSGSAAAAEADSTTTRAAPTTSTTLDFETEVKLAALELLELRNEVLMNPDPARVSEYIADTCVCLERERQIIEDLAADGRRWTGPAIEPLGITLTVNDEFGTVLTVAARQPAGEIVGPDGSRPVPEEDFAPYHVELLDSADGWRINALQGISLGQQAFDEISREGLP